MHLSVAVLFAVLSVGCAANRLQIHTHCQRKDCEEGCGWCSHPVGTLYTANGAFSVDGSDGCKDTGVPHISEFCVNWSQERAHFEVAGERARRCLVKQSVEPYDCGEDAHCDVSEWLEQECQSLDTLEKMRD